MLSPQAVSFMIYDPIPFSCFTILSNSSLLLVIMTTGIVGSRNALIRLTFANFMLY